jgi:hypothetical protein
VIANITLDRGRNRGVHAGFAGSGRRTADTRPVPPPSTAGLGQRGGESPFAMAELFAAVPADRGKRRGEWTRRAVIALFLVIAALAAWGSFGQRDRESTVSANGVTMTVSAPDVVRGGLYFQATVDITARTKVEFPRLVLDEGWIEGLQVNSIEPAAESETSRDGRIVLTYGGLDAGDRLKVWLQFQVDPTNPGRRAHGIEFDDETRPLVRIDRDLTVLP